MTFRLVVSDKDALRLAEWFLGIPPGIRVWHSVNLSNPGGQWITSIEAEDKPTWQSCSLDEAEVITDPKEVAVVVLQEVERFPVEVRLSGNGLSLKLTDASNDHLNERLEAEERGDYAYYEFDYDNQEAIILDAVRPPVPLPQWAGLG